MGADDKAAALVCAAADGIVVFCVLR